MHAMHSSAQAATTPSAAGPPMGSPSAQWAGDELSRREAELAARIGQIERQLADMDRTAPAAERLHPHPPAGARPTAFTGGDSARQRATQRQRQRQRSPKPAPAVATAMGAPFVAADQDENDAGSGYMAASSGATRGGDATGRAEATIVGERDAGTAESPSPSDHGRGRPTNPAAPPLSAGTRTPAQLDTPELTATPVGGARTAQRAEGEAAASPGLQSLPPPAARARSPERRSGRREGDSGEAES